jgi:hypothetical protein
LKKKDSLEEPPPQKQQQEQQQEQMFIAPLFSCILFLFDGNKWNALTSSSFDTSILKNVKEIFPVNDLTLGKFKLSANQIQITSQPNGFIALYGKGGELTHDEQLQFDLKHGRLQATKIETKQIKGKIDMTESELRGVEIMGGKISKVNLSAVLLEVTWIC